jgi:SAM-dependent methyltransferase
MTRKKEARVLDIGCNDGTLLSYYPASFHRFGIDPSDIAKEAKGEIKVIQDFFPSDELTKETQGKPFDIITAIAMFYDLEEPIEFVKNVKKHLAPEGLWIFEMSYMPTMLLKNSYDTICHEHLEYYSLSVLEYILKKSEMKMIKAGLNDMNGGSIRCYATHINNFKFKNHEFQEGLKLLRRQELDMELETEKPYRDFQKRIDKHKKELSNLLTKLKREGKTIHIYGASTKGNTILQFCNIDKSIIDYAADRSPDKQGACTIGTDIPIISEEESRRMQPDYYLVLPWHFREEFLEREKDMLAKGVGMIFPLPTIEIVKKK